MGDRGTRRLFCDAHRVCAVAEQLLAVANKLASRGLARSPKSTRSYSMRRFIFVSLFAFILLSAAGTNLAAAKRYCLQGAHWGYPGNCHFSSYSPCMASASGTTAHCGINPRYAHRHRDQGN
jgi:hypothetical protein